MPPNQDLWLSNHLEGIDKLNESMDLASKSVIQELSLSFPLISASYYPGDYIDRLSIDLGPGSYDPITVSLYLYNAISTGNWLQETLRWNFNRNCLRITGFTLIREHHHAY